MSPCWLSMVVALIFSAALSMAALMLTGVTVNCTDGVSPPVGEEGVADFRRALELPQRLGGKPAREQAVLPPLPFLARHVDKRGKVLAEEAVDDAVGSEQPGEIRGAAHRARFWGRTDSGSR